MHIHGPQGVSSEIPPFLSHSSGADRRRIGLIRLLERSNWQQHRAARQTIDATLTALHRILPLLDAGELAQVLAANNSIAAGEMVQRAAQTLTYVRQPDMPLPLETCRGYVRDFCQLVGYPECAIP